MIITCTCSAKLKIGDDKLTEAGVRVKCPKCGTVQLAKRPAPAAAEPVVEPAMPWFAPASSVTPQEPFAPVPAPKTVQAPFASASAARSVQPPPVSARQAIPAAPQSKPAGPSSSLVLVAHDSTVVADMIRSVVQQAGLTVEHATDGLEALKKATALKPRVMIVDVGLTGIYGFELCERLKGDPDTRSIKIILLSSVYGLTAYKRNPVTLYGADDYIEKHHIPDKLLPKLMQLLAGLPAAAPVFPPLRQQPADEALAKPKPVSSPASTGASVPERSLAPSAPPFPRPTVLAPEAKFTVPDIPNVMPRVPVTLDTARKRVAAQTPTSVAPPARVEQQTPLPPPVEPSVVAKRGSPGPEAARPAMKDESIKLDASFFEQDEYEAPAKPSVKTAADPEEIEKARRFARLVVSDIVLYNQETVTEGIAKGTFFELLKEDISEGRALYEKRVPEAIRATQDYYQEAFDNFIAEKKKRR